jgi:hypothetical protein
LKIRTVGTHKDVPLHDHQDEQRLQVVRANIDTVLQMTGLKALFAWAGDPSRAPESRLLAEQKCRALYSLAEQSRTRRPPLDLADLAAQAAGLDGEDWRSETHYSTLPEAFNHRTNGAVRRASPLPEHAERVRGREPPDE